ncbi:hypothetical protein LL912_06450 [Niabella sp. CC-SYL272]|uniref:DUF7674 family protein n=1 Tax=Niabella agricola TaxID=2891571 RepID=UPI001F36ABFA|nr:hypothetical protein [Niabella agricola]MCF3108410.1 hypothetical protein [Niabella agricola]
MNRYEIRALIEDELPAVYGALKTPLGLENSPHIMNVLVGFVKRMLAAHNLPVVIKCMRIVDRIYEKGDCVVRNAIEHVFIRAFSGFQKSCHMAEWRVLSAKIPITLFSVYIQQRYQSKI